MLVWIRNSRILISHESGECNLFSLNLSRTDKGETCLELSISKSLPDVVDSLCRLGADMSAASCDSNPPLWIALDSNQEDMASILVRYTN